MNIEMLAALARERQHELRAEFARTDGFTDAMRPAMGRALRAAGDRLFRWGVALDGRVVAVPVVESPGS